MVTNMKKIISRLLALSIITLVSACGVHPNSGSTNVDDSSSLENSSLNDSSSSDVVSSSSVGEIFRGNTLTSASGVSVTFKPNGATIESIKMDNTTIATDGFVVGRVANRIGNARFTLNGQTYNVSKNDGNNSLHGGAGSGMNSWRGPFATTDWTREYNDDTSSITYKLEDADGHNGYPGKMNMTVKYTLSPEGELSIEYTAKSDKDTLCNPTNHVFFTMNGNNSYNNVNLQIDADTYTPLSNKLPTGQIVTVENTKFDYRTDQAFRNESYDDNLVLNGTGYRKVAEMTGNTLGVRVTVYTDRPGLQLYKENNGKICLETQMLPDAINHDNFESPILRAGETFYSKTAYRFEKAER